MRNVDEPRMESDAGTDPGLAQPSRARVAARGLILMTLVLLLGATCAAVALLASAWLVPPYLALMILILFAPLGRAGSTGNGSAGDGISTRMREAVDPGQGPDGSGADSTMSPDAGSTPSGVIDPDRDHPPEPTPAPTRGKRGKGRTRKAKPVSMPVEASWIQVGPGKFVRVETPGAVSSEESPTQAQEPADDDSPSPVLVSAAAEVEGCDNPDPVDAGDRDDPTFGSEPVANHSIEEFQDDPVPAADGIAPQAEDVAELAPPIDVAPPGFETAPDVAPDPTTPPVLEPEDATLADLFQPRADEPVADVESEPAAPPPAPADPVPLIEAETPVETPELEQGETAVTVADREPSRTPADPVELAEPSFEPDSEESEDPAASDLPEVGDVPDLADPTVADVVACRPSVPRVGPRETFRLRPETRNRGGNRRPLIDPRAPRRPGLRLRETASRLTRPIDGRRTSRRGLGRPRQVARPSPPRSPP